MNGLLLRGRDHIETGELVVRAGLRVATALGRGGAAKLYQYTDPNEDASLCAEGPGGWFLAVADGHWGEAGARLVIDHLAERAHAWVEERGTRPNADWQAALGAAVHSSHRTILDAFPESGPRTTLALALARRPEATFFTACVGDSHLFWADAERCVDLSWPRDQRACYLGQRNVDDDWVRAATRLESGPLRETRALLAATDGLSEPGIGVPDPPLSVLVALGEAEPYPQAERAAVAAHRLAAIACDTQAQNGAGDNIAIAVAWCQDDA